ncbi:UNVERIFIED_CONTAM: hypothetical protein GTU68_041216 [Idotea baltica]|nr:hypothetical protein [Idotea baltica]
MSHEIRTPLTGILGFTDIAFEDLKTERQEIALHAIKRNGEHLLQVINDILDLSKIEANKIEIEKKQFNLFDLLNEIESSFKLKYDLKKLLFDLELNLPLPEFIHADEFRIRQILFNLVGNAIKFTIEGSVKLKIEYKADNNFIVFHIEDTGIGLTEEEQKKLFEPFTQGDISTTRKYGGSGLGLSISKEFAELHGGFIGLKSDLNKGSCFSVYIPCGIESRNSLISERQKEISKITNKNQIKNQQIKLIGKVLVVDDMPDNRELITYFLQQCSLEVETAENGAIALDILKDKSFDLILLDMQMPIVDGYQCVKEIRTRGLSVPVVALTASTLSDAIGRCINAGCDSYMRKPFQKEEFFTMLKSYLKEDREVEMNAIKSIVDNYIPEIAVNDKTMAKIVLNFVNGLDDRISSLNKSYEEKDWENFRHFSHKLAGAKMFGFEKIGETALALEQLVDNSAFSEIEPILSSVNDLCIHANKSKKELKEIVDSNLLES